MSKKKAAALHARLLEERENDTSRIGWIPEDILIEIITYFEPRYQDNRKVLKWYLPHNVLGLTDLARLGAVSKLFNRLSRDRRHWVGYYRSLYPISKIGPSSVHAGPQTWASCRVGNYPGWNFIHESVPVNVAKCSCPHHYGDTLEDVQKSVRWKDPFKMSARRTWTLVKKQYVWNDKRERQMQMLIKRLTNMCEVVDGLRQVKDKAHKVPAAFAIHRKPLDSSVKRSRNRQQRSQQVYQENGVSG